MAIKRGQACLLVPTPDGLQYFFGHRVSRRHSPMALRMALLSYQRRALCDEEDISESFWATSQPENMAEARGLRDAGNWSEARALAMASMANQEPSPEWINFLGQIDLLEGNAAQAKQVLIAATQRWPAFASSHNNLAAIYWSEGKAAQCLEHLIKALEAEPDNRDIVINSVRILVAMGKKEDAQSLCATYLKANPADAEEVLACLNGGRLDRTANRLAV